MHLPAFCNFLCKPIIFRAKTYFSRFFQLIFNEFISSWLINSINYVYDALFSLRSVHVFFLWVFLVSLWNYLIFSFLSALFYETNTHTTLQVETTCNTREYLLTYIHFDLLPLFLVKF